MRPPSQGPEVITQDVMRLTRVLRRVQCDPKRTQPQKDKITSLINETISLLTQRGTEVVSGVTLTRKRASTPKKRAKA